MKWLKDSHIKHEHDAILLEKEYFCILDKECMFGYATRSEVILKNGNSSSHFTEDTFVPPVNTWEHKNTDSQFVPPVNDDEDPHTDSSSFTGVSKREVQNVLLLFVKADSGSSIITTLKSEMKLSPKYVDDLYLETMNLWVGTKESFNRDFASDFSLDNHKGDIPKLEFVIIQVQFVGNFKGYHKGANSMERMEFFKQICKAELPIVRLSNRLNFSNSPGASLSWIK